MIQCENNQSKIFLWNNEDCRYITHTYWYPIFTAMFIILVPAAVILLQVYTARIKIKSRCSSSSTTTTTTHEKSQVISSSANNTSSYKDTIHSQNRRRIQHALTGFLFYILSYILPYKLACALLSITTTSFYILHLSRSKSSVIQQQYIKHFGSLLRHHEYNVHTLPGAFWFLLGTTILVLFFSDDMDIVRTSLLCLSFGDPIASFVGVRVGGPKISFCCRHRHNNDGKELGEGGIVVKSFIGSFSCFITSVIISRLCIGIDNEPGVWFVTGFVATFMEFMSSFLGVDDNILIPIGTASALSVLKKSV